MTPREGVWREVQAGSYVRDEKGRTWRVDLDFEAREIILTGRDGTSGRIPPPKPDKPVTILEPTEEEAMAAVRERLGGRPHATKTPGSVFTCVKFGHFGTARPDVNDARSHLMLFHGIVDPGIKTLVEARKAHDDSHALFDEGMHHLLHAFQPHTHTERFRP